MSTNLDAYRQQLLFALRLRNVPAARIGEAIAEVESHLAETGDDPVAAFGEPAEYARQLAESLDHGKAVGGTGASGAWFRPLWANAVVAGFVRWVRVDDDRPAPRWLVTVAIGLVLLVGLAIGLVRWRSIDRIVDRGQVAPCAWRRQVGTRGGRRVAGRAGVIAVAVRWSFDRTSTVRFSGRRSRIRA
jgi:hypothetical protein